MRNPDIIRHNPTTRFVEIAFFKSKSAAAVAKLRYLRKITPGSLSRMAELEIIPQRKIDLKTTKSFSSGLEIYNGEKIG
jgi:hypothetical protein